MSRAPCVLILTSLLQAEENAQSQALGTSLLVLWTPRGGRIIVEVRLLVNRERDDAARIRW